MHKQVFDLRTGVCLDDDEMAVTVFATRVRDGPSGPPAGGRLVSRVRILGGGSRPPPGAGPTG
ncbi:hypothetical protein G1H11_11745 [Phytoactinopolyspora alkaliphila]|uniref:Rieske-like [2Fe-2S] domain-containing protein n=1 Tax=Phytoactinopolyspora alkaliphila TaxID=1783498 RepID=A0A6N9YLW3_9ACTN|nr:nitrite reductase (NAD(P)H) small subunit [Phytoactinopolyspora alkaliphila]NED95983.1 hypothetical protein [Phytoactinopolyspora alkaliphila]